VGQGAVSVGNRLTAIDGNPATLADLPSRTIIDIIDELADAHSSTAYSTGGNARLYDDIDDRFEAIEQEIANAHITNGATLDARFDNIDGGSVPTRTLPDVITEVNAAHRSGLVDD